jgi:uncharacterized protein YjbJ (UPF0337 family)
VPAEPSGYPTHTTTRRDLHMGGITDKITGKVKQAAGDITNDGALRREGLKEERKGEAKDELAKADQRADDKAHEVADLERKTS